MCYGAEHTFHATVSPSNATNQGITWSASNNNATIDTNGKVTVVANPTSTVIGQDPSVTITAMAQDGSGEYYSCVISLTDCTSQDTLEVNPNTIDFTADAGSDDFEVTTSASSYDVNETCD